MSLTPPRHTDPLCCKEIVHVNNGMRFGSNRQCRNKPSIDGYCKQHHPDNAKARREKADKEWRANFEAEQARKARRIRNENIGREVVELFSGEREPTIFEVRTVIQKHGGFK